MTNQPMQPDLLHERLDVYRLFLDVAGLCGGVISSAAESIAALDHLDRAMESVGINLMRANTRTSGSPMRSVYLDTSIASTNECAASLDVCLARKIVAVDAYKTAIGRLWRVRGMLLGLKRASANQVREESAPYGTSMFPFAGLDMYQSSLEGVRWTDALFREVSLRARGKQKLDIATTGTVLNIAEGHGRMTATDQNRFMRTAEEHAFQTVLLLDLMAARREIPESRIAEGKAIQTRVISMLHKWCIKNRQKEDERG